MYFRTESSGISLNRFIMLRAILASLYVEYSLFTHISGLLQKDIQSLDAKSACLIICIPAVIVNLISYH